MEEEKKKKKQKKKEEESDSACERLEEVLEFLHCQLEVKGGGMVAECLQDMDGAKYLPLQVPGLLETLQEVLSRNFDDARVEYYAASILARLAKSEAEYDEVKEELKEKLDDDEEKQDEAESEVQKELKEKLDDDEEKQDEAEKKHLKKKKWEALVKHSLSKLAEKDLHENLSCLYMQVICRLAHRSNVSRILLKNNALGILVAVNDRFPSKDWSPFSTRCLSLLVRGNRKAAKRAMLRASAIHSCVYTITGVDHHCVSSAMHCVLVCLLSDTSSVAEVMDELWSDILSAVTGSLERFPDAMDIAREGLPILLLCLKHDPPFTEEMLEEVLEKNIVRLISVLFEKYILKSILQYGGLVLKCLAARIALLQPKERELLLEISTVLKEEPTLTDVANDVQRLFRD
eukprot:g3165.t1